MLHQSRVAEQLPAKTAVPFSYPETAQVTEGDRLGQSVDLTLSGMGVSTPKHGAVPLVRTHSNPRLTSSMPEKDHTGPSFAAINNQISPVLPQ